MRRGRIHLFTFDNTTLEIAPDDARLYFWHYSRCHSQYHTSPPHQSSTALTVHGIIPNKSYVTRAFLATFTSIRLRIFGVLGPPRVNKITHLDPDLRTNTPLLSPRAVRTPVALTPEWCSVNGLGLPDCFSKIASRKMRSLKSARYKNMLPNTMEPCLRAIALNSIAANERARCELNRCCCADWIALPRTPKLSPLE